MKIKRLYKTFSNFQIYSTISFISEYEKFLPFFQFNKFILDAVFDCEELLDNELIYFVVKHYFQRAFKIIDQRSI
jgi:hypothetical protein